MVNSREDFHLQDFAHAGRTNRPLAVATLSIPALKGEVFREFSINIDYFSLCWIEKVGKCSLEVKFFDSMNMQTIQKPTCDKTCSIAKAKSSNKNGTSGWTIMKSMSAGKRGASGCEKLNRQLHSDPPDVLKQSVQTELDLPILRKMSVNIRLSQPIRFESVEDKNGFI